MIRKMFSAVMKFALVLMTIVGLSVSILIAQEEKEEEEKTIPLEEIVVTDTLIEENISATKTGTPLIEVPQAVQVIDRNLIEDTGARDIAELARHIGNVNQGEYPDTLVVRGFFGGGRLTNGLRGKPVVFSPPTLNNIERVEVLMGPSSLLYGSLNPGGTVNFVTKRPRLEPTRTLNLSQGIFNQMSFGADFTGPMTKDKELLYRIVLNLSETGDDRDFHSIQTTEIYPSLTWNASDDTNLTFLLTYTERKGHGERLRGIPVVQNNIWTLPRNFTVNEPGDFVNGKTLSIDTLFNHRFNKDLLLTAGLRYINSEEKQGYHEPRGFIADNPDTPEDESTFIIAREYRDQYRHPYNFHLTSTLAWNAKTGPLKHIISGGLDTSFEVERSRSRTAAASTKDGNVPDLNVLAPVYNQSNPMLYNFGPVRINHFETLFFGLYLQEQMKILEKLNVLAGLRFDRFDELNVQKDTKIEGENALTLRGGVLYQPRKNVSTYVSYSEGFEPQPWWVQDPSKGGPFPPTESWQVEAGAKAYWLNQKLNTTLSLFQITKTNIPQNDPDNPGMRILIGEVQSQGLELEAVGYITNQLSISTHYASLFKAEVTKDANPDNIGKKFANAADDQLSLWVRYAFLDGRLVVSGGPTYIGKRINWLNEDVPTYWRWDAAIHWNLPNGLKVGINMENLTDVDYVSSSIGGRWGHFRGASRNFRVNLGYQF